jgi:Ca2+/Na+ antiporter
MIATNEIPSISLPTMLFLLLSGANLALLGIAFSRKDEDEFTVAERPSRRPHRGMISLGILFASQLLYLAFVTAWIFRWMHFYPGNPVETVAIVVGLSLSSIALLLAIWAGRFRRLVGILVGVITLFLWLLSALISAAV